ncbi:MAG: lipoprotein transporter ATP-binding protein [Frondihabitans sp.]|nr:lipoprotein transporter ATP-binding protein [Frondihabitans sp.]
MLVNAHSTDQPLIRVQNLGKKRGDHTLWSQQSFTVAAGTSLAITGPSGAGKTTLLNCIGLLERADTGTLELDGTDATHPSSTRRRHLFRNTVSHLFQNYALVESWPVDRNLDVAFIGRSVSRGDRRIQRAQALDRVGLRNHGARPTHTLSGGEQQRVALARLLLKKSRIIAADEPSAALDDDNVAMVLSVLDELRDGGAAIVIATHDEKVSEWCDERLHLDKTN